MDSCSICQTKTLYHGDITYVDTHIDEMVATWEVIVDRVKSLSWCSRKCRGISKTVAENSKKCFGNWLDQVERDLKWVKTYVSSIVYFDSEMLLYVQRCRMLDRIENMKSNWLDWRKVVLCYVDEDNVACIDEFLINVLDFVVQELANGVELYYNYPDGVEQMSIDKLNHIKGDECDSKL